MLTPIEEIKSKIDIVDFINEFVPLKQAGANFKAHCPFHQEKTPSFMVSRERQFFKCFGCGEFGDVFSFLQKYENIDFPEALRILAEKTGVKLVRQDPKITNLKTRLLDLHKAATEYFHRNLLSEHGKHALEYLIQKRKLTLDIVKDFKLGLALNSWEATANFLKLKNFNDYEIKHSGLVVEKSSAQYNNTSRDYYDRFRHRLMFPIEDHHLNVVGFTARAMDDSESAKYINTPQTLIYNKSQILYGLSKAKDAIKSSNLLILVEGNMDVIASYKAGIKNVVAASGTSLTQDQIKIIKRYTDNVAICFDADAAGIAAGTRGIEMLWQNEINVKVIILPKDVKDPDELICKNPNLWAGAVKNVKNFMDYFFEKEMAGKNLDNLDDKRVVAKVLLPWIARLADSISQDHYLKLLAEKINIEEQTLRQGIVKIRGNRKSKIDGDGRDAPWRVSIPRHELIAQRLLSILIFKPNLIKKSIDQITDQHLTGRPQEFYKHLIICYTRSSAISAELIREYLKEQGFKDLILYFDELEILGQTEFGDLTERELLSEYEWLVAELKKNYLLSKRTQLQAKIKDAEWTGNLDLANKLLEEFVGLH